MDVRRARKLLKKMELESYTDVIHTIAIEDWTHPYGGDEIVAEKTATAASARSFLQKARGYRDSLFSFYELSYSPAMHLECRGTDLPDLIPILNQYLLHLTQLSEIDVPAGPSETRNSITWVTWLIDYINYREWGQSRTNLINLINDQNE